MRSITLLDAENIEGKVVLVRVDYNVPIQNGIITDDLRIKSSLKTVDYLRNKGAKVILISHIESNAKSEDKAPRMASLGPVSQYPFAFPITFRRDIPAADNDSLKKQLEEFKAPGGPLTTAPNGSVFLFENLRNNPGEKENNPEFAAALASIADLFVGDAFSVSHRSHASVIGIPALLPHYAGFQIADEVMHLEKGINPPHPFIFVLGGAKFDTKLPLIEKFMKKADRVLIGGALFNDIMKGRGLEVGKSLVSNASLPEEILKDPESKLIEPDDVVVKDPATGQFETKAVGAVLPNESVMDTGHSIIGKVKAVFDEAAAAGKKPFILWNGPLGDYEDGFKEQTVALAELIIASGVDALIGGGDTTAVIARVQAKGIPENVYVSTGGGAMIDYLINETLPGIDALK